MPSVQLFVPALLSDPPAPIPAAAEYAPLRRWLARARYAASARAGFHAALFHAFGLNDEGELPIAAATLRGEGKDPDAHEWMRADPVHLRPERNDLVLIDAARLAVDEDEAAALVASLDRHFATEGMHFLAPTPARWYVKLDTPIAVRTVALDDAAGRGIDPLLPRGRDALLLHRHANEAQMLLHDHPVNAARAQRGVPEINSLWFWGAGHAPAVPVQAATSDLQWWSDDALVAGLAACTGARCRTLPPDAAAWLDQGPTGRHALVLPAAHPSGSTDRMADLLAAWLAPMLAAVSRGRLAEAVLVTVAAGMEVHYALRQPDLLKFWRRTPRLPRPASDA